MSRLQKKRDGARLLADDGLTLLSLAKYGDKWSLSCWVRDPHGRPLHGGLCGTTVAGRAAGLAAIERLRSEVESMHAAHVETARRLAEAIIGPPDGTAEGEHARWQRQQDHALSISSTRRPTIEVPAIAFVRLLAAAARGDLQLASLLHKAVRVEAKPGVLDDATPELADALAALRSADLRRQLAEGAGSVLGVSDEEALVGLVVSSLDRLRSLAEEYDELVAAVGCGKNTAHETVVRKARQAGGAS